jgi:rubrerythrin
MRKPTSIGPNRTGAATSPIDSQRLAEASDEITPDEGIDGQAIAAERLAWAAQAEPVGTMPPPVTVKGVVKAGFELLRGRDPTVFLDKLAERAAFERGGTRLYEALLVKHAAAHIHEGGPTREELELIRDDELRHYAIARDAMIALGADPTALTPSANVTAVMSSGLVQVLTDPRTTLTQCLQAMLAAELVDNDGWQQLAELADALGQDELAARFRDALAEEDDHLARVRSWIAASLRGQLGVEPTPAQPDATI